MAAMRRWRRQVRPVATAAGLAALFAAAGCGEEPAPISGVSAEGVAVEGTTTTTDGPAATSTSPTGAPSTSAPPTTGLSTSTTVPGTTTTAAPGTTTTAGPGGTTSTSVSYGPHCQKQGEYIACAIPGRPLRRWWRRALLLPSGGTAADVEARSEYASVASFGELALRLIAVGAPPDLVAACHAAALDEVRHAATCDDLDGRERAAFGAIPQLAGRRLGGWRRSRAAQLRSIARDSLLDGWVNEGRAAAELRRRAAAEADDVRRAALAGMAADEQRHAELGRAIATWCWEQDREGVGRALAAAA